MDTNSPVYNELNKAWKATCRILFREEIGDLKEYEEWLKEYLPETGKRKSHVSGKEVVFHSDAYCINSKFISLNEMNEKSIEPLTINEIKDIDSIIEAISERWEYCGNKVLGKSSFIMSSDLVFDSYYISDSMYIENSLYVFSSEGIRANSKYVFGSSGCINGEFIIHLYGGSNLKRCFEIDQCAESSDLFFCMNCDGCSDLMFSFNQKNKRNMIGNLALSKDKYLTLKSKLIAEIRDELKKEKKLPSLFQLLSNKEPSEEAKSYMKEKIQEKPTNITPIEKAFSSTFKVLFKKETSGIDQYERWLARYFKLPKELISPLGNKIYATQALEFSKLYNSVPERRIIGYDEAITLANLHLDENDIQDLNSVKNSLGKIAYFCFHFKGGKFGNIIKTAITYNSSNVYKTSAAIYSEYAAVNSSIGSNAKYVFGSHRTTDSQFCIHSYDSSNITRCFELDACNNCSDTYFAHNCEGLAEAMFCWNVKGKRYAIGNVELPPEQYRRIKDMLVAQMADEIIKTKQLRYDIFNIGCGKK
jgi:hypothetical protein